jgi:hypothetical protein
VIRNPAAALLAGAALVGACGRAPEAATGAPAVAQLVTLAPAATAEVLQAGTRLVRVDGDGALTPLAPGFAAAGRARVACDGRRWLCLVRAKAGGPVAVYVAATPDATPVRASPADLDCSGADFLADGRIVFAARPAGRAAAEALWVSHVDAPGADRITFGGEAREPSVLCDGRVLFVAPHAPADGRPAALALFTVHPDGTGITLFHHGTSLHPRHARPRQGADGDVVVRAADDTAVTIAWDDPREARARGPLGARTTDGSVRAPQGETVLEVVALRTRPRPQGHLSRLDPGATSGTLLCLDARDPDTPAARRVRLLADGMPLPEVPLAPDGSFFVRVPSDRPLTVEVRGEDGSLLRTSHTPFWVRPGEIRGCVGCHEPPDQAPRNRRPDAVVEGAIDLAAGDREPGR